MNKKIRKVLDSMCHEYRECEICRLFKDIQLGEGFIVHLLNRDVYLELANDEINIWDLKTSEFLHKIEKTEFYVMTFELGQYLELWNR